MYNTPHEEIMIMARKAGGYESPQYPENLVMDEHDLSRFAAIVAAKERERIAAQLVFIGDGYGVRDKGLSEKTYSLMQQTAYEHAAIVMTDGKQWSALSPEELTSIRVNGIAQKGGG